MILEFKSKSIRILVFASLTCTLLIGEAANGSQIGLSRRRGLSNDDQGATAAVLTLLASQHSESPDIVQSKHGSTDPMSPAATNYHHKKSSKGWLDMGAWTKKKGAFGWYADYPVGKGRR